MKIDAFHSHGPSIFQSYHALPPFTFPRDINASEDADADTVSMYSESSSSIHDSSDTARQAIDTESEDFGVSSNDSQASLPDTTRTRQRSAWLPEAPQAGYFVFPDPFSSGRRISSSAERTRSYDLSSSEDEESIAEDEPEDGESIAEDESEDGESTAEDVSVTEGHDGTPSKDMSPERKTERVLAESANKQTSQFLPLLKDEPNYPRNPSHSRGLDKINKRLRRATTCSEEPSAQSDRTQPISGIHPALRPSTSQPAVDNEAVTALQAEVRHLKADIETLRRSENWRDNRQAEALRHIDTNKDQLVGGWGRVRDELFNIKVMQEQLWRRVNMEHGMNGRWQTDMMTRRFT